MTTHAEILTLMTSLDHVRHLDRVSYQYFEILRAERNAALLNRELIESIRREVLDMVGNYGRRLEVASVQADPVDPTRVVVNLAVPIDNIEIHFVL